MQPIARHCNKLCFTKLGVVLVHVLFTYSTNNTILGTSTAPLYGGSRERERERVRESESERERERE